MIWASILLVPLSYVVMFKSPLGLRIRACGEHPRAADTVGINVYVVRYASVVLSGVLAAMGGAYLTVGYLNTFNENVTAGRGFIALAALIFGKWKPLPAAMGCVLFGLAEAAQIRLQGATVAGVTIPVQLIQILPYLVTILVLAGFVGKARVPAALGAPFERGRRRDDCRQLPAAREGDVLEGRVPGAGAHVERPGRAHPRVGGG